MDTDKVGRFLRRMESLYPYTRTCSAKYQLVAVKPRIVVTIIFSSIAAMNKLDRIVL